MAIAGNQITRAKIVADAIDGTKVADDTLDSEHYIAASIDNEHLADNAVGTDEIAADAVTYAKIQNVSATDKILGRDSASAGIIEEITPANVRTMLNVEDGATADQSNAEIVAAVEAGTDSNTFTDADHTKLNGITASANAYVHPNHSGEITSTADGATVIAGNIVDEANLKVSNAPTNGHFLSAQSGDTGGMTWAAVAAATAADDIGTGDAAVSITTSSGNITIDAAANNSDIIFKGTDATADITMLTLDGSEAGKAIFNSAITGGGLLTTGGNIVIPDAGNIGSASDTDAIAISSAGVVTFSGVVTPTVSFHLPSLTAVPSSPSAGNIYFDTDDKKTWVYNGTSWNSLLSQGVSYRYTRYYVVSASAGHHPRISRVYLIQQDGTKVQVYNASSADNCTDGGDIPANDANYTDDAGAAGGKIFTGFGFYSTYTGGNRGSNIKLEGSVDNSTWVQIGQTVDAQSNSACGEIDLYV